jgi:plasmid stabilization system protein ParE
MRFAVLLTNDAARDLDELYEYIAPNDAPGPADTVLARIAKPFAGLSESREHDALPHAPLLPGIRRDSCDLCYHAFKLHGSRRSIIVWNVCGP